MKISVCLTQKVQFLSTIKCFIAMCSCEMVSRFNCLRNSESERGMIRLYFMCIFIRAPIDSCSTIVRNESEML